MLFLSKAVSRTTMKTKKLCEMCGANRLRVNLFTDDFLLKRRQLSHEVRKWRPVLASNESLSVSKFACCDNNNKSLKPYESTDCYDAFVTVNLCCNFKLVYKNLMFKNNSFSKNAVQIKNAHK